MSSLEDRIKRLASMAGPEAFATPKGVKAARCGTSGKRSVPTVAASSEKLALPARGAGSLTCSSKAPLADGLSALLGDDVIVTDEPAQLGRANATVKPATPLRLRGKTTAPQWVVDVALSKYREMVAKNLKSGKSRWRIHQRVQDAWRKYFNAKEAHRHWKSGTTCELTASQKRPLASAAWKALSPAEHAYWFVTMQDLGMAPRRAEPVPVKADASSATYVSADHRCLGLGAERENYQAHAFLLTYNGDWGQDLDETKALLARSLSPRHMTEALRNIPFYRSLFEQFKSFLIGVAPKLGIGDLSGALEHSTKGKHGARVHLQCFVSERSRKINLQKGRWRQLTFDGVAPSHISKCLAPNSKRRENHGTDDVSDLTDGSRASAGATGRIMEGHYYFAYAKVGGIFQWSTLEKYVDYFPRVRWVANAIHARKMDLRAAEQELMGTRMPCKGMLDSVQKWVDYEQEEEIAAEQQQEYARMATEMRPFKACPPHVEARVHLWRRTLDDPSQKPRRSKPIVIDGPSQLGKSQWAIHQFGGTRTLVVNCQGVTEPPLRFYARMQSHYDSLVLEEADWRLVHKNKLLFQSTNASVDMASSATSCFAYRLRAFCVPMFILSNDFYDGIDDEKPGVRAYVEMNVEFWSIDPPLFED